MSVSTLVNRAGPYDCDGTTRNWPYSSVFSIIDTTDIKIYLIDSDDDITQITSNYEVDTDLGEVIYPTVASGLDPIEEGNSILLVREMPINQLVDLITQGSFNADTVESMSDKLTMIIQQLQEQINRCISVALNEETITLESFLTIINNAVAAAQAAQTAAEEAEANTLGAIREITQAGHSFVVGEVLRRQAGSFVKAKADSAANAEAVGIVIEVVNVNVFKMAFAGYCSGLSGLTDATVYFLSPDTAGALTSSMPSTVGQIIKPVFVADSTTSGYFINYRGNEVEADDETTINDHLSDYDNPHQTTQSHVGLSAVTNDAQLKRASGDFATFTEKSSPASTDLLLIEDSAASNAKKKIQIGNLPSSTPEDNSISQAKLKTSTGEVSIEIAASSEATTTSIPGGEYAFMANVKADLAGWVEFLGFGSISTLSTSYAMPGATFQNNYGGGPRNGYAQSRYITSSGPDHWIFLLTDKATNRILRGYFAPDHPCCGTPLTEKEIPHPFIGIYNEAKHDIVLADNSILKIIKSKLTREKSLLKLIHENCVLSNEKIKYKPREIIEIDEWGDRPGKVLKKIKTPDWARIKICSEEFELKQRTVKKLPKNILYKKLKIKEI